MTERPEILTGPIRTTGSPDIVMPMGRHARPMPIAPPPRADETHGRARWPFVLAALVLLLHLLVNLFAPYGVHRDEYLYLAMGQHLRLWRMDFPPMIALVAIVERFIAGDSLVALRIVPALVHAALVLLAARAARELGGGRFAQTLAALCVAASPLFLRAGNLFQPVVLDQLVWTAALLCLIRLCATDDPRWWLGVGVACGVGLLVKFSVVFLAIGILLATLATPHRRALLTRWPWLALLVAAVIGSPSIVGQLRLAWPAAGQYGDLRSSQLVHVSSLAFALGQLALGPAVILAGLAVVGARSDEKLAPFRLVIFACVGAFLPLLLLHGKPYYFGPAYPVLFAAGAVWMESRTRRSRHSLRRLAVVAVTAYGLWTLPVGIPILPPQLMHDYLLRTGLGESLRTNRDEIGALPQDYADMLGWTAMVDVVGRVHNSLPPADQARAVIVAGNYGEAGALDFHGPSRGLPEVVSPAGSYWFFGPGQLPGDVVIAVGPSTASLREYFADVREVARTGVDNPWLVAEERGVPVHVARRPRRTLQAVWPSLSGKN